MTSHLQSTIRESVTLSGVGVHRGQPATVTIHPAAADQGVVFARGRGEGELRLRAHHSAVVSTTSCTVLGSDKGVVATVEHLMAALGGLGIDNVLVEIDGDEMPILDGSSAPFVDAIRTVGTRTLPVPRRFIKVLKPIRVQDGDAVAELVPYAGQRVEVEIAFDDPIIGRQSYAYDFESGDFARDVARARTFGFLRDVDAMRARGLALGASLDNTIVVGEGEIVNPEGLRYRDEFVRHKALDAIGDLRLAGAPVLGAYRSLYGGHRMNAAVLGALLSDSDAWTYSYGHSAPRREAAHAELADMLPSAAYGPEAS